MSEMKKARKLSAAMVCLVGGSLFAMSEVRTLRKHSDRGAI